MTSPFNFVRNALGRGNKGDLGHKGPLGKMAVESDRYLSSEPQTISLAQAKRGFYRVLFDLPAAETFAELSAKSSVPQRLMIDVVRSSLSEKDSRARAVPRLPSIIPRLMRSFRDPDASLQDFVSIIRKDPALSAGVLRLANSAYFNPTLTRVESIEVAVVKLGIDGLRVVLSAAVMQPVIQGQSQHFPHFGQKLWEHTLTCALACEQIASVRGIEPYKAYLLGLVHEVGRITLFNELGKEFQKHGSTEMPPAAVLIPLLEEQSYSLSAAIAVDWDLPKEIVVALQQQIDVTPSREMSALAQVLFQANVATEAYLIQRYLIDTKLDLPALAQEMKLPSRFFMDLDRLSTQV